MTIAIICVLVVIVLVGVDITVHVAKQRPTRRDREDQKIIVDLTKRK